MWNSAAAVAWFSCCAWLVSGTSLWGQAPLLQLGNKPSLGLGQPRVTVTLLDDGVNLGPRTNGTFLLDTGANSVLTFTRATNELRQAGFETVGTYEEQGVAGFQNFDVSAPYDLSMRGTTGAAIVLPDVQVLATDEVEVDTLGLLQINGIVGMPGMVDRVTTIDIARGPTDFFGFMLHTTFSQSLPAGTGNRYAIELAPLLIPPTGNGPFPTSEALPTLTGVLANGCQARSTNFILDTGAQASIISRAAAFELGLDRDGDGSFAAEQVGSLPIGGIGGTVNAPQLRVPELRIPTADGVELVWKDLVVLVQDIDPRIEAVFGADFFSAGSVLDPTPGAVRQAHFDFRGYPEQNGSLVLDLAAGLGTPAETSVPSVWGDTNFDTRIDQLDLQLLAQNWQRQVVDGPACGDYNFDDVVDIGDLVTLASVWQSAGNGAPPQDLEGWLQAAAVPEPMTGAAVLGGALAICGRLRRRHRAVPGGLTRD